MCDLSLEHPSISRFHAVIQFKRGGGAFVYDLRSTHGTRINKERIPPNSFVHLPTESLVRFGESTRLFIFHGLPTQARAASPNQKEIPLMNECSWGMRDEPSLNETGASKDTPQADDQTDAFYMKDPKKFLRDWFDARGLSLEFDVVEEGFGKDKEYRANIRLPMDFGIEEMSATGTAPRKRDAEVAAAIDACRRLDRLGILRDEDVSQLRRKKMKQALGSSDEDEDVFYNRTGERMLLN